MRLGDMIQVQRSSSTYCRGAGNRIKQEAPFAVESDVKSKRDETTQRAVLRGAKEPGLG